MGFSKNQALPLRLRMRSEGDRSFTLISVGITAFALALAIGGLVRSLADPDSAPLSFYDAIGSVVATGLMLAIAIILALIMWDIYKDGKPFTMKTVWRLRAIAVLTMLESVAPWCAAAIAAMIAGSFADHGSFSIDINFLGIPLFVPVFFGFFIAAISEFFYYGCELQQDVDSIA